MDAQNLHLGDTTLPLGGITYLMAVLNVSPDSKNTHTVALSVDEALLMAERYRRWGASIIDVGGQSSHFENPTIAVSDEVSRVAPVVEALAAEGHLVAVDTWKPDVARAAVASGAMIVNDTGGLADPEMRRVVAEGGTAAVLVYVEGSHPHDVGEIEITDEKASDIASSLSDRIRMLDDEGITNVIVDPGIALNYRGDYRAYTQLQLQVISGSTALKRLGRPVLIPIPRKRDFHRVAAYVALALEHEADLIRVHDVPLAADLARLFGRMD